MIQGCTSDAGKSTIVAGLCRLLQRKGLINAPFKPQNMALNSAVTDDGGEIGRAQALQAIAAKVPLSVHMNPVLLKPNSDTGAQVILQGQSIGNLNAMDYHAYKPKAAKAVFDSFQILSKQYSNILVEGAGSPAEINLRQNDIANMGFAEAVDCQVILVADIDKGGVFAHIVGTLECLSESEKNRIKGFIINRFRGDIALLQDGLDWLEAKTGKPVLGVLPYLHGLHLDAEDAIHSEAIDKQNTTLKVIAPLYPHISNHTDLDPLIQHPQVDFQWIKHNESPPPVDCVILPGSKSVISDLTWLKSQGWQSYLQKHLRYGGKLIGICGGLQMLGQQLLDPQHLESEISEMTGLHLMPYQTEFFPAKHLTNQTGRLNLTNQAKIKAKIKGYEIHQGQTNFADFPELPHAIEFTNGDKDGLISADNQIFTTYLHGLFDEPKALQNLLNWAGLETAERFDVNDFRESQINRLADCFEKHLNLDKILAILQNTNLTKQPVQTATELMQHQIEAVYQTIASRRDMRHFVPKSLENGQLQRFLHAANQAPSVGLMQPWRFIRISDVTLRHKIYELVQNERKLTAKALNQREDEFLALKVEGILQCAEVVVVALKDQREKEIFGRRTLPEMDIASVGCAIQNLALAARAEGIGVGWVSIFDPNKLGELLNLPAGKTIQDSAKPLAILCIGHVENFYEKPMLEIEHWRQSVPLENLCFENSWQNKDS